MSLFVSSMTPLSDLVAQAQQFATSRGQIKATFGDGEAIPGR
jgi:hypothetical protein